MSNDQHLFLMEFLVDRVRVPSIRAINENVLPSSTYISFQVSNLRCSCCATDITSRKILNLPVINIYQDDTTSDCTCPEDEPQIFRKGKSCLFALPTNILEKPLHSFPITMSVYKKLPPEVLPDVMLIGSHQIELKDLINSVLKEHVFHSGNSCKTMKDTFKIATATGQLIGNATVFIRASCFGKKIITQFQIPHNKKPYLFKGSNDSPVFACKRIPSNTDCTLASAKKASRNICGGNSKNKFTNEFFKKQITCPPPPPPSKAHLGLFESYRSSGISPRFSPSINTSKQPHKKCGCPGDNKIIN